MSIGDLLVQGMQGLQGPNPRPNPMPNPGPQTGPGGASPGPGAPAPPQGPSLPPAQAYGPDPSTAASIQALMQMHEQDRRANGVDRGMAMMAGLVWAAGDPRRDHELGPARSADDRLHAMAQSTLLQNAQTAQTEHMRAMGGSRGASGQHGDLEARRIDRAWQPRRAWASRWRCSHPDAGAEAGRRAAAVAYKQANPNATDEEIARFKSNILTNMTDPAARAANQDIAVKMAEAKNPAAYNKADTQARGAAAEDLDWFKAPPRRHQDGGDCLRLAAPASVRKARSVMRRSSAPVPKPRRPRRDSDQMAKATLGRVRSPIPACREWRRWKFGVRRQFDDHARQQERACFLRHG